MSILLITDILNLRARKEKELAFYTEQKDRLEVRLNFIRHELDLTDLILKMLQREHK